jgi:thiamine kinase-like enzyme
MEPLTDPARLLPGIPEADAALLRRLPCLTHATVLTPLEGGITNRNYRAETPEGILVIRVSDLDSSLLAIDREAELRNSLAAAYVGVGAPVVDHLPGQGVLVVGWIHGRTLEAADLHDPAMLARIAAACRRLHAGPRFVSQFDMFAIQQRYLRVVQDRGMRLPADYLDHQDAFHRILSAMRRHPEPTAPCHNDLLAANFIDDGRDIRLIDYEYAGNNEPSFELGNIWSESTLPLELLDPLVEAYWGAERPDKVARARLWGLVSKYGWLLWASIQESTSSIEFDFWDWGLEKYDRAVAEFRSADLERLITAVTDPTS